MEPFLMFKIAVSIFRYAKKEREKKIVRMQNEEREKKDNQLKIDTVSGDVTICNLINRILDFESKLEHNDIKNNEHKIEKPVLKKPDLNIINEPTKDEFETTEQYNIRYKRYKNELEINKKHYVEKLQNFKKLKAKEMHKYTKERNELIKQLEKEKHKIISEQKQVLEEEVNIYKNSRIFPKISISIYDADKELFKIFVKKHPYNLKINMDDAKQFKNSFDLYEKKIKVKIMITNHKLFYKYIKLEIKTDWEEIYKINLTDDLYRMPISSYKNIDDISLYY